MHLQGLVIDSQVTEGAPPRIIHGEAVPNIKEWYQRHQPAHMRFLETHLKTHDAYIAEGVLGQPATPVTPGKEDL